MRAAFSASSSSPRAWSRAIARALRLTDDERDHLFALAGVPIPDRAETSCLRDGHLLAIEKFMPFPAAVQTARFDILAYNRAYRFLFGDLDRIEPERLARLSAEGAAMPLDELVAYALGSDDGPMPEHHVEEPQRP